MTANFSLPERYYDTLLALCRNIFASLLASAAADEESWKARIVTFERHGLLSFATDSPFARHAFQVDNARLYDPRYRSTVIRKLKAPRPGKFMYHTLHIHRERLADPQYASDMAKVLAYKWADKIFPVESEFDALILLKLDRDTVAYALDNMLNNQVDAAAMARLVMRLTAEELVEAHPLYKKAVQSIKAAADEARKLFAAAMEIERKKLHEDWDRWWNGEKARIDADCDAFVERLRKESAARESSQKVLDESRRDAQLSPEKAFAKAPASKRADSRKPWLRW